MKVCLVSGGIDSTILLHQIKPDVGIFFDYGQTNLDITLRCAKKQCKELNIPLEVLDIKQSWIKCENHKEGITSENIYSKNVKDLSWVEGRNALFLLNAMSYVATNGGGIVYTSFQFDEKEWELYDALPQTGKCKFPAVDLIPEFIENINQLAVYAFKNPVVVKTPYIDEKLSANDIAFLNVENNLKINFDNTYSCRYFPKCNECEQCIVREERLKYATNNS